MECSIAAIPLPTIPLPPVGNIVFRNAWFLTPPFPTASSSPRRSDTPRSVLAPRFAALGGAHRQAVCVACGRRNATESAHKSSRVRHVNRRHFVEHSIGGRAAEIRASRRFRVSDSSRNRSLAIRHPFSETGRGAPKNPSLGTVRAGPGQIRPDHASSSETGCDLIESDGIRGWESCLHERHRMGIEAIRGRNAGETKTAFRGAKGDNLRKLFLPRILWQAFSD